MREYEGEMLDIHVRHVRVHEESTMGIHKDDPWEMVIM
jgi:hypothetical protein